MPDATGTRNRSQNLALNSRCRFLEPVFGLCVMGLRCNSGYSLIAAFKHAALNRKVSCLFLTSSTRLAMSCSQTNSFSALMFCSSSVPRFSLWSPHSCMYMKNREVIIIIISSSSSNTVITITITTRCWTDPTYSFNSI